jgi:hypothetical protein
MVEQPDWNEEDWPGLEEDFEALNAQTRPGAGTARLNLSEEFLASLEGSPPAYRLHFVLYMIFFGALLAWMYISDPAGTPGELWQAIFVDNAERLLYYAIAIAVIILIGLLPGGRRAMRGSFDELAIANLRDHGLLRDALNAHSEFELHPPWTGCCLLRDITSSDRLFTSDEQRIRYLLANYEGICDQRRLRRSMYPYLRKPWIRHSILWGEWAWERWQNSLRHTVADLLRSGNY